MSKLIKELRELAASEEVADRAADELERLIALDSESKLALDKFNKQLMTENGALRKELAALKASTEQWNETMRQKKAWADGKDAEPVAWRYFDGGRWYYFDQCVTDCIYELKPLYTTPPTGEK